MKNVREKEFHLDCSAQALKCYGPEQVACQHQTERGCWAEASAKVGSLFTPEMLKGFCSPSAGSLSTLPHWPPPYPGPPELPPPYSEVESTSPRGKSAQGHTGCHTAGSHLAGSPGSISLG